jgi:tRNA (Thr-GGU) A37 N-methylase
MKGQFIIVDLRNMHFMKNKEGKINYYDTMEEACDVCGMYEFEDAWVLQLMHNHKESDTWG